MRITPIKYGNFCNYPKQISKNLEVPQRQNYISSLQCLANQNIAFCAKKPIYAMDKDFNLFYFDSILKAAFDLGLNDSSIVQVLKHKNHVSGGYTFAYASDIEYQDDTGEKCIDFQAVKKLEENFKKAKTTPVYVIDYDANIRRFDSETKAADFLGVSLLMVNKAVNNYSYTADEYIVVPASKIELKDEEGNVVLNPDSMPVIDYEKVKSELSKFSNSHCAPICSISYLGEITRYENRQELLESKRYSNSTVSTCLNSRKPKNEVIFVYENEILKRDNKAKPIISLNWDYEYDLDEINRRLQIFADVKSKPIKAKNIHTKEISYYPNASKAAENLGISKQMVSKCLKNECSFNGYSFEYLYPMYLNEYQVEYYRAK